MKQYFGKFAVFVWEWIKKHRILFIALIISFLIFQWVGIVPILIGFVVFILIAVVIAIILPDLRDTILEFLEELIRKRNEENFNDYLKKHCMQCGYMDEERWNRRLSWWYKVLPYESSFEEITENFAVSVEKEYIENDEELKWLDPIVHYLTEQVIADIAELERVPNPYLNYTHYTPNAKLIYDAMNKLCVVKKREGKFMIQRINLEEDPVREQLQLNIEEIVPEYYKAAYRINDYFVKKRKDSMDRVGNIVSEEIRLEDL